MNAWLWCVMLVLAVGCAPSRVLVRVETPDEPALRMPPTFAASDATALGPIARLTLESALTRVVVPRRGPATAAINLVKNSPRIAQRLMALALVAPHKLGAACVAIRGATPFGCEASQAPRRGHMVARRQGTRKPVRYQCVGETSSTSRDSGRSRRSRGSDPTRSRHSA